MAVRIRLKKLGRKHRPFYRLCAMDGRAPRDGRVLEELGTYDPLVSETDARAVLKGERIAYWLSVGAQPSEKAAVLIKKYGQEGTHLEKQKAALERLAVSTRRPDIMQAVEFKPMVKKEEPVAEAPAEEAAPEAEAEAPAEPAAEAEAPAEEAAPEAEEEKSE